MKLHILSILPSPYQRDMFHALSQVDGLELQVFYNEASVSDSPWPEKELEEYEHVLSGFYVGPLSARFHMNKKPVGFLDADVIILNGYMNNISQWVLRKKPHKRPPVFFWGERMHPQPNRLKGFLKNMLSAPLKKLDGIVAIGSIAQKQYQSMYPDIHVDNIPYLCSLKPFMEKGSASGNSVPVIICCGQMIRRKGVDLLIQSFANIIEKGIEAKLLLVGREAELPEFLDGISEKVKASIEFAGFQSPEKLPEYFSQADLFVLPSRYDGWGVVVNQALGSGLPIVCSDAVGAAADLVVEGKNGRVCQAGDVSSLETALYDYLSNKESLVSAKEHSEEMRNYWTPEAGALRWKAILDSVLGS